jgi:hypothetical protein
LQAHTLYKQFIHIFSFVGKHVSVTSSTGIAATHYGDLGACTLHKWGGLHDGRYQNSELLHLILTDERFGDVVKWRVEDNACSFEFLDILKYTETCFLIHKTHEEITVGMFTGDILNGNRLIAEIKFRIDLKWSVSVCGKAIDLETIGLTNIF